MPRTKAVDRAIRKYDKEKVDKIMFRVPKGKKELVNSHAEEMGESMSSFLNRAIDETMERDNAKR